MSILVLLFIAVLLPILLFSFLEFNHYWHLKEKFQSYNDHIASSAVMCLDEEFLKEGTIVIDTEEATKIAEEMMKQAYHLNDDLTISEDYLLKSNPVLKVYVINSVSSDGTKFITDEGYEFTLYKPSVIVYTECQPNGILFDKFINIKSLSVQEASFKQNDRETTISSESYFDDISFYVERVVNPYRFTQEYPFREARWSFSPIPMSAGGNVTISANVNNMDITVDTVTATIEINGTNYSNSKTIELKDEGVSYREGLTLISHPSPNNLTATWIIRNNYDTDIAVNWRTNLLQSGTVIAKANSDTYFETFSLLQIVRIWASVNGELITNGDQWFARGDTESRTYTPVDNNNGEGVIIENRYVGTFNIPKDCPVGARVNVRIDVNGTWVITPNIEYNISFPENGSTVRFGTIENKIKELLRFNKK